MSITNVKTMSAAMPFSMTTRTVVVASESVRCNRQSAKRKDGS